VKKFTDCINEDRSMIKLVEKYLSQATKDEGDSDEDEDAYDNSSDEDEATCNNLNSEL
jgi:hypothetical protein